VVKIPLCKKKKKKEEEEEEEKKEKKKGKNTKSTWIVMYIYVQVSFSLFSHMDKLLYIYIAI